MTQANSPGRISPWQPKPGEYAVGALMGFLLSLVVALLIVIFAPPKSNRGGRVRFGERELTNLVKDDHKHEYFTRQARTIELPDESRRAQTWLISDGGWSWYAIVPVIGHPADDTYEGYAVTDYLESPSLRLHYNSRTHELYVEEIGPFANPEK